MPTFELALVVRTLAKPELSAVLRRAADVIFDQGGFIRRIDNLGAMATPYKIGAHGVRHKEAHYFIMCFESSNATLRHVLDSCKRDVDVVRSRIQNLGVTSLRDKPVLECTLAEDLKPPPYRKSVQEMIAVGERKNKKKAFNFGEGYNHYPFQI